MDCEHLIVRIEDRVAHVTMNRPERLDAWNPRMAQALCEFFGALDARSPARAVILEGAGRAFCPSSGASRWRGAAGPRLARWDETAPALRPSRTRA